jgi:hypothetical protein
MFPAAVKIANGAFTAPVIGCIAPHLLLSGHISAFIEHSRVADAVAEPKAASAARAQRTAKPAVRGCSIISPPFDG